MYYSVRRLGFQNTTWFKNDCLKKKKKKFSYSLLPANLHTFAHAWKRFSQICKSVTYYTQNAEYKRSKKVNRLFRIDKNEAIAFNKIMSDSCACSRRESQDECVKRDHRKRAIIALPLDDDDNNSETQLQRPLLWKKKQFF